MSNDPKASNVTGRDSAIMLKALAYGAIAIQTLPEQDQEWSDMKDMCRLLRNSFGGSVAVAIVDAEMHTARVLDLFPDRDMFSDDERDVAEKQLAKLVEHRAARWKMRRQLGPVDIVLEPDA